MTRRAVTTAPRIKRQPADPKIRLIEAWACEDGHQFGFDPDRCKKVPRFCPNIIGLVRVEGTNLGKWQGCPAAVHRVRAAGVLR